MPAFLGQVGNSCNIPVDQVVVPPMDRSAGCLSSLIIVILVLSIYLKTMQTWCRWAVKQWI